MPSKLLVTQSLLSAWNYSFISESGYEDFIKTLERESSPPTKAMLAGREFEGLVETYMSGSPLDMTHEWAQGIQGVGDALRGAAWQVKLSKDVTIDGAEYVLYGILDALKAGVIYDVKYTSNSGAYRGGKYSESPQHPMYFEICPNANKFVYLISNGVDVCQEEYLREDTPPIENQIRQFMAYLDKHNLTEIYHQKWRSKY